MLSGSISASGLKLLQKFTGGVAGVVYKIIFTATGGTTGQVYTAVGYLYVEPDLP